MSLKGKKISAGLKKHFAENGSHWKGRKQTKEHTEKIRLANLGRKRNKATIEKMKIGNKIFFENGGVRGMTGKKHSEESKKKISEMGKTRTDELSNNWKGDNCGKSGMHYWVVKKRGKASEHKCEHCGGQAKHWANKKHDYKRNLEDYMPLCASCHKKYDLKNNIKTAPPEFNRSPQTFNQDKELETLTQSPFI